MTNIPLTVRKYMSKLGKKGSKALIKKRGNAHFSRIAKKRWDKRKVINTPS